MERRNMCTASRVVLAVFCIGIFFVGSSAIVYGAGFPAQMVNLPDGVGNNSALADDDVPEVTARVARISFLIGEAKIKRADSDEWEIATLNLPIVENDEIATGQNSRLEIQFDKDQHLRIAENSFLKITNLKDQGIAVSISLGTMSVRILSFDIGNSYFEIDAPKTTLAIQRAGSYRIDAGNDGDTQVRLSVTDSGEARVYSDDAGFTIQDGRTATIFIGGRFAGEWEMANARQFSDDFDNWTSARDNTVAAQLKDAYYDKYYDDDIYGAEDLDDNGDWVNTSSYGYVWRPSRSAISRYADWSPYRYGHWRWVGPFGWTWVNDEPWGWATYHHGRWFYDSGYWNWSPYGYYRQARSWWSPALVVISVVNNNICWYPLPYRRARYDYNWRYQRDHRRHPAGDRDDIAKVRPRPTQTPLGPPVRGGIYRKDGPIDELDKVPVNGVITIAKKDFGTTARTGRGATDDIARTVLSKRLEGPPDVELPAYSDVNRRFSRDIVTERPKADVTAKQIKLGAAERKSNSSLDQELRTKRFYGGREPGLDTNPPERVKGLKGGSFEPRKTGVIDRNPVLRQNDGEKVVTRRDSPRFDPPADIEAPRKTSPVRTPPYRQPPTPKDSPRFEPPAEIEAPRKAPPVRTPPYRQPPTPKDSPRFEATPEREKPKNVSPPQRQPTRREPPARSEPKQDEKPAPAKMKEYKKPNEPGRS